MAEALEGPDANNKGNVDSVVKKELPALSKNVQPSPDDVKKISDFLGEPVTVMEGIRSLTPFLETQDKKICFNLPALTTSPEDFAKNFNNVRSTMVSQFPNSTFNIAEANGQKVDIQVSLATNSGNHFNLNINGSTPDASVACEGSSGPEIIYKNLTRIFLPVNGMPLNDVSKYLDKANASSVKESVKPVMGVNVDSFDVNGQTILRSRGNSSLILDGSGKLQVGGGWAPNADVVEQSADDHQAVVVEKSGDRGNYFLVTLIDTKDNSEGLAYKTQQIERVEYDNWLQKTQLDGKLSKL
jgi:hypothetical protein